ncbi:MAG: redoxin domain-containing protein [Acidobacteriaceae bacterium]
MDTMIKIGETAPEFQLPDLRGGSCSLSDLSGWIRVLNFWSAECTWSERVDHELITYLEAWKKDVKAIWIASNANEGRDLVRQVSEERSIPSLLLDPDQSVADLYGAQTTPHFFVLDKAGRLAYQGAWDDITFRQRVATRVYIPQAVEALMHGQLPKIAQTPPYGCALVRFPAQDS